MGQKTFLQIVKELSILVGIGVVALIVLNFSTDIFEKSEIKQIEKREVVVAATTTPVSLFPEYDITLAMKKIILLPKVKSYTPNGNVEVYSYTKYLKSVGEFTKMYLYTEVSFNGGKLTGPRDLYIKFQNRGGHIKNKPLLVPESPISRFLYDIDNIQYVATIEDPKIEGVSWLDIFNTAAETEKDIRMDAFVSSRKEAWIEKMELYYQCSREIGCSVVEQK